MLRAIAFFLGVPGGLPTSRMNDDVAFIKACARARWRALLIQKLPILVMMTPVVALYFATKSKVVLVFLVYLIPFIYVPLVGILAGYISSYTNSSFELQVRRELARLRPRLAKRSAIGGDPSYTVPCSKTDIDGRVDAHRKSNLWVWDVKQSSPAKRAKEASQALDRTQRRSPS